jgi:cell division protein FtsZ
MGSASAEGESRAIRAVEQAMSSPLLNDSNIKGARYVLVNVTCGEDEITMDELGEITDYIQDEAGMTAEVIKGYGVDMSLGGKVNVTIIATGFNSKADVGIQIERAPEKRVFSLMDEPKMPEPAPVVNVAPATNKVEEMTSYIKEETNFIKEETKKEETTVQQAEDIVAETPAEPFVYTKEETVKTEQTTFEFEITNITNSTANAEEPFLIANAAEEKVIPQAQDENTIISKVQTDEQLKKAQDRVAKLKELSFKLKSPNGLSELENEPAYKRRNINLDQTPHSSESQVSRYTLSENDDKKVEIKPNNSFLHDNVD